MSSKLEPQVRIIIADDHELLRVGLRRLLETQPNFIVTCEAADSNQTIARTRRLKPDILLLDLAMPKRSGLEVLRDLGKLESVRIILLTAAIEKHQADEALELGARGIILKGSLTVSLFQAIDSVLAGDIWLLDKATKNRPIQQKTKTHHGKTK